MGKRGQGSSDSDPPCSVSPALEPQPVSQAVTHPGIRTHKLTKLCLTCRVKTTLPVDTLVTNGLAKNLTSCGRRGRVAVFPFSSCIFMNV